MGAGGPSGRRPTRRWWAIILVAASALAAAAGDPASAEPPDTAYAPIAPFAAWTDFLDQAYADLLPSPPPDGDRAAAADALRVGAVRAEGVITAIRTGPEHQANVDPVIRLYRAFFLRIPDAGGLDHWIRVRRSGAMLGTIAESFARSSEFVRRYGPLSDRAFVELIYANVLERAPDRDGVDYWTRQLAERRRTRGTVMVGFSESSEHRAKQSSETTAAALPILLLGRAPSAAEFEAAVARLDAGGTADAEAKAILATEAYQRRAGRERVVVLGDSIPQSLIEHGTTPSTTARFVVDDGTVAACDGADDPPRARTRDGTIHFMTPACQAGWKVQYPPHLAHPADRAILMTGVNAMLDHELSGTWRHPCHAAARTWYHDDLVNRLRYLHTRAARVVVVLPAWPEENSQWIMPPDWIARADCVRAVMAQAAHDTGTTTIDLGAHLCPSGPRACRPVRRLDGIHVDVGRAAEVLEWVLSTSPSGDPPSVAEGSPPAVAFAPGPAGSAFVGAAG